MGHLAGLLATCMWHPGSLLPWFGVIPRVQRVET